MPKQLRSLAALTVVAAALSSLPSACSLVVDGEATSCESDADCVNYANFVCDTDKGECVSADKCTTNADCADGEICRFVSPRACVKVVAGACSEIYPPDPAVLREDDTLLLGMTVPLTENGVVAPTGISIANGARLAIDEINEKGGVGFERKIALLICDDGGDRVPAEENGRALAALGIQGIIGAAYSGQTQDMAKGTTGPGTIANGIMSISSSATSADISGLADEAPSCKGQSQCPGLVWRTSPSDRIQGDAIVKLLETLEPLVRTEKMLTIGQLNVGVLYKDDSYGRGLRDVMNTDLQVNGKSATDPQNVQGGHYLVETYGDTSDAGSSPDAAAIERVIAKSPHIVLLFGTEELGDVMAQIEAALPGANAPYYVFADGGLNDRVFEKAASNDAWRRRVFGTVPGTDDLLFQAFSNRYLQRFGTDDVGGPTVFGAAGAYDAVYLFNYAATEAIRTETPLTGVALARGMSQVGGVGGKKFEVGPTEFGEATGAIRDGEAIDIAGASGRLDFDLARGEAPSDIQIWCLGVMGKDERSGVFYSASEQKLLGSLTAAPCRAMP
jgi:branched-chain amino acid transport system substrate-binding protein